MPNIAMWVDPHIDVLKKLLGEEVSLQLSRKLLLAQLNETRKIGAKYAIILGDIFHSPHPSQEAMGIIIDVLSSASDIKFLVLLGNHDIHDATTNSLRLLSKLPKAGALTNTRFITKETKLNWATLQILALPFGSKPNNVDDIELIVFHDQVIGAKNHNGPDVGIGQGISPSKFKKVLSVGGDNHLQQNIGKNIFYPGIFASTNFGEEGSKYFAYVSTEDLKYHLKEIKPSWKLKTINWSNKNIPECNESDTYYRILISEERPPARWLVEHPQVVKIDGGSKTKLKEAASKIVSLVQKTNENNETDSQLLTRWLKTFTPLDKVSLMQAVKIHNKFGKSYK